MDRHKYFYKITSSSLQDTDMYYDAMYNKQDQRLFVGLVRETINIQKDLNRYDTIPKTRDNCSKFYV